MRNERPDVSAVVIVSLREVLGRGSERADRLYKYEWVQKKAMLSRSQGGQLGTSVFARFSSSTCSLSAQVSDSCKARTTITRARKPSQFFLSR